MLLVSSGYGLVRIDSQRVEDCCRNVLRQHRVVGDEFRVTVGGTVNEPSLDTRASHQDRERMRPVLPAGGGKELADS